MSTAMRSDSRFLSVAEVALRFGVSAATVRRWIADGHLAAVQPAGAGAFRVPATEIERLVERTRQAAS